MNKPPIKIYVEYIETEDYKGYFYTSYYPIEKINRNKKTFEIQNEIIKEIVKYK